MKSYAVMLATTLLMAGCAGGGFGVGASGGGAGVSYGSGLGLGTASRVVTIPPSHLYTPLEFSYAAGGRDLTTEISGNPFGMDQATFDQVVTDLMRGRHFGPPTNFTTTPGPSAREPYHVVLAFNPEGALTHQALCLRRRVPTQPLGADGRMTLQAAFCRGGGMMTGVVGYASGVRSIEDPAFRRMIADTTLSLFPPVDPDRDDDCRPSAGFLGFC